jgi:hypothetical protein
MKPRIDRIGYFWRKSDGKKFFISKPWMSEGYIVSNILMDEEDEDGKRYSEGYFEEERLFTIGSESFEEGYSDTEPVKEKPKEKKPEPKKPTKKKSSKK